MSETQRTIRIAGNTYGEHFGCCAAIQSIEHQLGVARNRLRRLERDIELLEAQRDRRAAQLAAGAWPPPSGHEAAGLAPPTTQEPTPKDGTA